MRVAKLITQSEYKRNTTVGISRRRRFVLPSRRVAFRFAATLSQYHYIRRRNGPSFSMSALKSQSFEEFQLVAFRVDWTCLVPVIRLHLPFPLLHSLFPSPSTISFCPQSRVDLVRMPVCASPAVSGFALPQPTLIRSSHQSSCLVKVDFF